MENKILFISSVITLVGVLLTPHRVIVKPKNEKKDTVEIEAEKLLKQLKHENEIRIEECVDSVQLLRSKRYGKKIYR